ncbi:hypothetical protein E2C01_009840 [Portunus trituberculatus]|uniref:Uncharacterized protein n=1 Tax=Portunus trituberculatus TaxID=210409 RepID=A0A5B7D737_PORTR|nr:hypothetical protein [Portunus trituberculatus]
MKGVCHVSGGGGDGRDNSGGSGGSVPPAANGHASQTGQQQQQQQQKDRQPNPATTKKSPAQKGKPIMPSLFLSFQPSLQDSSPPSPVLSPSPNLASLLPPFPPPPSVSQHTGGSGLWNTTKVAVLASCALHRGLFMCCTGPLGHCCGGPQGVLVEESEGHTTLPVTLLLGRCGENPSLTS